MNARQQLASTCPQAPPQDDVKFSMVILGRLCQIIYDARSSTR